jgi:hypothetical protein
LTIRKTIRTGQKEFNHIVFIELSMVHFLEKANQRNSSGAKMWNSHISYKLEGELL